jgi:chromate transporter
MNTVQTSPPRLSALFSLFFQIGAMSFGGGLSAWLYREIVERRRWLSESDFLSGLALAQVMPGINMANLSVYVGQRLHGARGAIVALVALLSAPFFAIIALASVFGRINSVPWFHSLLAGIATAAVGLVLAVALKSLRTGPRGVAPFAAVFAVALTVGVLRWPMVPVVLCVAPLSVYLAWRKGGVDAR